ncbi:ABC transporter substrate-binding protein [Aeromicrobium sp. HA]|uniref:ABC transporter substrate-binding protein n=1 Tax=Aeromicrobium sp. HA TaxID=3009077 RepID=UPI0022AE76C5|nr:ABC transporter substrate-binding protein [Aeromicrobium sp. HA]
MRKLRSASVVAVTLALLAVSACTTSDSSDDGATTDVESATGTPTTSDETYRIGLALPFTGPSAAYGEEFKMAVEIGIEDVNEQFKDDGISLELVTADTQATAEGGVSAMNKLGAVDKVPAVITAWGAVVSAGSPVAEDLGLALLNAGAQSPALIGSSPNLVNALPMNDAQLANYAEYLVDQKGYKKFATIYVDNETGQGTADAFKAAVEARGATVVAQESIRQDATDATTQVAKVKDSGVDFLYVQTLLVEGASTMKAVEQAKLDIPVGSYAGVGESKLIRAAGQEAMNDLIYMSQIPEDVDGVKALMGRIQDRAPKMVLQNPSYDAYFYATAFLYAEAIKELRAQGAPVTGTNVLAIVNSSKDLTAPIVGPMDFTDKLTYHGPTIVRQITNYEDDPLDDTTVDSVTASN